MRPISLKAVASFLPENIIDNEFFKVDSDVDTHPMFQATRYRRHIGRDETCCDMGKIAISRLAEKANIDLQTDVDILITNTTLLDIPFVGAGAALVGALNLNPKFIYDIQSGGCVSFIFMMELVRALISSSDAKSAIICNFQTAAGRIFSLDDNRKLPQSAIPGDGCGVGYITADDTSPIEAIITRVHGESATDMYPIASDGRKWWEPGLPAFNLDFNRSKIALILNRGNRLVPEALHLALKEAKLASRNIDAMVTNQPNKIFLRNWREAMQIPQEKQVETFDEYGNLFGSAIPISFERGVDTGVIKPGSRVLMGGFSHAGDYTAAAVVHWYKNG